jgi:hypothetical protein
MKLLVFSAVLAALLCSATCLFGQAVGIISVFSDETGFSGGCSVYESNGELTVYVVHDYLGHAAGSRFRVVTSTGFTGVYLHSEVSATMIYSGNVLEGVHVGYVSCRTARVTVASVTFATSGTSNPCSTINLAPDPSAPSGMVEIYDCDGLTYTQDDNWQLVVNASCLSECPVGVDNSTWGAIKALYR